MAIDFNGTSDYIEATSAVVTEVPLTLACWFNADNETDTVVALSVGASTGTERWALVLAGAIAGDPVRALTSASGAAPSSSSATGYDPNIWYHGAARFSANNNRRAYINGVGGTANTTTATPTGVDRTTIGCGWSAGSRIQFTNGRLAECGIWNVALDDDEIAALSRGYRCSLIRPNNLVFYAPIIREVIDLSRGRALTTGASPTVVEHTRRIG